MAYRHLDMKGAKPSPDDPSAENVVARRLATRYSVQQQMAAQDSIIPATRRIVASVPFGPCDDTFIPDTNPDGVATNPTYPDATTEYPTMRLDNLFLTPGCVLVAQVLALPSGPVQYYGDPTFDKDGAGGTIVFDVTLTNPDTTTVVMSREIEIPVSLLQYHAKPSALGSCWSIVEESAEFIIPPAFDADPATQALWSEAGVQATVTISFLGSPRPIDIILYEQPRAIARDTTDTNWGTHIYAQGGKKFEAYPHHYPVEETTTTDPVAGFEHMLATCQEHAIQLGPALFTGSCFDQGNATILGIFSSASHGGNNSNGTGDNEAEPIDITSTSFVHLTTGATSFDVANPGYAMGCGAYGRHYRTSGQDAIIPNNGVVPVLVAVYGTTVPTSGVTGTVRFQVSAYSYVDVTVTDDDYQWTYAVGWLECGTGPEDDKMCQLLAMIDSAGTLSIRYWGAWFLNET